MKLVIFDKGKKRLNRLVDWLLYMFGYTIVLIIISLLFPKHLVIENAFYGLVGEIIIYILNKTIKPIIVRLTIPLTALTFGIFYPFINILILYIVSFILKGHFEIIGMSNIKGILALFVMAILISIMNGIMEHKIIKPIINRGYKENE